MKDVFEKRTVLNLSNLVDYSNNSFISKQILKIEAGNITLFPFDKGQDLSEHSAPFDAIVQILDGKAEKKSVVILLLSVKMKLLLCLHIFHKPYLQWENLKYC